MTPTTGIVKSAITSDLQRLACQVIPLALTAACVSGAFATELLTEFQPSDRESSYGTVSQVQFSSGLVDLQADTLVQSPKGTRKVLRFNEPVWLVGFKSEIVDAEGQPPQENYLCHTFFGDADVVQQQDQQMRAVYSDAFTQDVQLPDGFGLPFGPHDDLQWFPLFNNRSDSRAKVGMKIEIHVIRERDLGKPLRRLYSTLLSVQVPHLYFVPPGRDVRGNAFELPAGKIHAMGTHIHPFGVSIELINVTRDEPVWKSVGRRDEEGALVSMPIYKNPEGYTVRTGDFFELIVVYDNTTGDRVDAMAGIFVLYSPEPS